MQLQHIGQLEQLGEYNKRHRTTRTNMNYKTKQSIRQKRQLELQGGYNKPHRTTRTNKTHRTHTSKTTNKTIRTTWRIQQTTSNYPKKQDKHNKYINTTKRQLEQQGEYNMPHRTTRTNNTYRTHTSIQQMGQLEQLGEYNKIPRTSITNKTYLPNQEIQQKETTRTI